MDENKKNQTNISENPYTQDLETHVFEFDFGTITRIVCSTESVYGTTMISTPGGVFCGTIVT